MHPTGISFPAHTEGQRMGRKEDKWREGCTGAISLNPEGCCDSSNWGAAWDRSWWVEGAGRTLRLFTLPLPGLHTVWKVLHIQLRPRWASTAEDHEGWNGQWAGDHARHPAGRVPARMGGDWYVTSLRGPFPKALGLSLHQGTPGLHPLWDLRQGLGSPPSLPASRHLHLRFHLTATLTFLWLPLPGSVTHQGNQPSLSIPGRPSLYK